MKRKASILFLFLLATFVMHSCAVAGQVVSLPKIIVAKDGSGDFKTIQGAINSLDHSTATAREIFIKMGVYHEKIYLEKNNVILTGEDREKTIITFSVARDEWRCLHNDDWGVATLNIDADDITLQNLTVTNSRGFDRLTNDTVFCLNDTVNKQKIISRTGHQMALRTMNATRFKAVNCHFRAFGGDTVSPWNVNGGMFYFKDCVMEGGVDFYCPRGWAYAENCEFIAHSDSAAIWHDGSKNPDSKTVLKNCSFKGFDGFKLGRYHRDAQFYLVNCSFAANMADAPVYLVPTNNIIQWGHRVYFANCHRQGGNDFKWFGDNLASAPGHPQVSDINANWVFGERWKQFVP